MEKRNANDKVIEKVLNYWFTLEFLEQDKYPDMRQTQNTVRKLKNERGTSTAQRKMVWDFVELNHNDNIYDIISSEAIACGMKTWGNLTFYIGKVKRETCIDCIAKKLSEDEEERPEKSSDEIAWASLQLSPTGKYIEHSLSISTIIWSLNQIAKCNGNLSDSLDERQYHDDIENLEKMFFDVKNMEVGSTMVESYHEKYTEEIPKENLQGRIQEFDADAVSLKTLGNLYKEIKKRYFKENILMSEEEYCIKEIYGISFQLFMNEKTKNEEEDDNYLGLNHNFYSNDIKLLMEKVRNGELRQDQYLGKDIMRYISAPYDASAKAPKDRIDLVKPPFQQQEIYADKISEILSVENAPLGKWPSKFMPAFMQQIAINLAIGKGMSPLYEINGKIFSVNGPPGTGKTTLLKEIIVNNIVERAILLAQYDKPDDAFDQHNFQHGEREGNAYSKYIRHWYTLKNDRINDYSVLVTSCNNTAVENITKELPVGTGIFNDLRGSEDDSQELRDSLQEVQALFDVNQSFVIESNKQEEYKDIYFTNYARMLLDDKNAWGLIAAPLGKKTNIRDFYWKVLKPLHWDFYPNKEAIKERKNRFEEVKRLFLKQLLCVKEYQGTLKQLCCLNEKKSKGLAEVKRVTSINLRQIENCKNQIEKLTVQMDDLNKEFSGRMAMVKSAQQKENQIREEQAWLEIEISKGQQNIKKTLEQEIETRSSVNVLTKIFNKPKYVAATRLADEYKRDVEVAKLELTKLQQKKDICEGKMQDAIAATLVAEDSSNEMNRKLIAIKDDIEMQEKLIKNLGEEVEDVKKNENNLTTQYQNCVAKFLKSDLMNTGTVIDEVFIKNLLSDDSDISTNAQVSNPWFTQQYNREREKLFYYAMRLNKEFVLASKCCRDNFRTLTQYWGFETGDEKERIVFHKEDREECVAALYQTLFLLVPVFSSTFASVGTFLKDIKQSGVVGTLIIDEAGQASPQLALGALYRSRRAVIVGDPKQVEPVVTDDLKLLKKAFNDDVLKPYKLKNLSVQEFADQLNAFGTFLDNGTDEPDWVGCPLLVHRRCISPMYDISNEISYNNIMKQQTKKPNGELSRKFVYEKSQWINVKGKEKGNKNHFVESQGQKVCEILETAFGIEDYPDLYIISPFTSVVSGIKRYIYKYCEEHQDSPVKKGLSEWIGKNIGTVHTFQGKEANEVIFLLGCDGSKGAQGAIRWVSSNIVNVAATRAKFRLYVIGDEDAWKNSNCVSTAKTIIDTFAIREIQSILKENLPEEEEKIALAEASNSLPSLAAFSVEELKNNGGETDYCINTTNLLRELTPDFMKVDLSELQLKNFGFESMDDFNNFLPEIRENVLLGIKLFYLLQPVYKANSTLDASCCAILFCKALELQIKDCFTGNLKLIFPDFQIRGCGSGRNTINLKNAKDRELTLGTFATIIQSKSSELGEKMQSLNKGDYNVDWWNFFAKSLKDCTNHRNACCHSGLFSWKELSKLLFSMFREGDALKTDKMTKTGGVLFKSEVGKLLN